jgi:holo-[acyl-carrier protein] synthase
MIFGIGTDIVRVTRMQENIDRHGDRFAERILTAEEFVEYREAQRKAHFLAKRFAAKEATAKAFGTGFAQGIQLAQIGVGHDAAGKPELRFIGAAAEFLRNHRISHAHLSLADEEDHAVAFVTLSVE